ncbi:MAG: hypothetical protein ABWK02_07750 [Aquificaceae bacterium]
MRKLSLKFLFLYIFLSLLLFFVLLFLTLPKFLVLDKMLLKNGLYLTAQKVEEGLTYVKLKGVVLYDQNSKLVRFDSFNISLSPFGLSLSGLCDGKSLYVEWSLGEKRLKAKDFTCLGDVESLSGDILIKDGLYGKLEIKGLKAQELKLEELSLDLKGRVFTAKGRAMGLNLVGDGQIVFNPSNPLKSTINGQVSGGGMRLVISGRLERLELKTP